jgi:hypothetical protein
VILIAGLPAHILLVHAVVVLGPIAGLAAIVYAVAARWRRYLAWPLGVLALVLVPISVVTAQAGEQLQQARPATAMIQAHAQQGDVLKIVSVFFFVIVAAMIVASYEPIGRRFSFLGRLRENRVVRLVLLVAGALIGAFFVYQSIITGHSGASSVWSR